MTGRKFRFVWGVKRVGPGPRSKQTIVGAKSFLHVINLHLYPTAEASEILRNHSKKPTGCRLGNSSHLGPMGY